MRKATYRDLNNQIIEPEKHKISVIVSIYNVQSYLEKAIQSICQQTYKNLEIILVDDGSTDKSGTICDKYAKIDSRIKVIHKLNGGLSDARNAGVESATGKYIAFVDGDDWIDEGMYEDMLRALQTYDADLAICNYKEISKNGVKDTSSEEITIFEGRETLKVFIEEDETYQIQNAAWNKLYKRSLMGELRFPKDKLFEDIVYTTKLIATSQRTVYVNKAYYNYIFDRSDSIMNSKKVQRLLSDQVPAYDEKGKFLLSIEERKLYLVHKFFFYKRMLLHCKEAKERKPEGYRNFIKEVQLMLRGKVEWEAYQGQSKGEKLRMHLFMISPLLYDWFNVINETYILPYKLFKASAKDPLVVVQLSGGMGNQMFQYALYLQLKALGRNAKIDDKKEYVGRSNARPVRLSVFDAKYITPTEVEMKCLTDSYLDVFSKIRRKVRGRRSAEYAEKSPKFDSEVWERERAYFVGWWQSEKYFAPIKEKVREQFTFKNIKLSEQMLKYEKQILANNSVSIHIRRGDYLDVSDVYGGICTPSYYEKAMQQMEEWNPDCHFFVFTNDVEWVKENYKQKNLTIVEGNDEDSGYIDMYLMTKCKHYILANSSFSWWGCYLNPSKEKRVIAPKIWANGKDYRDIYTDEMNACKL